MEYCIFRGHLKTFVHVVHLLQNCKALSAIDGQIQVSDILQKLLGTHGGPGHSTALLGIKHAICWGFDDTLNSHVDIFGSNEVVPPVEAALNDKGEDINGM